MRRLPRVPQAALFPTCPTWIERHYDWPHTHKLVVAESDICNIEVRRHSTIPPAPMCRSPRSLAKPCNDPRYPLPVVVAGKTAIRGTTFSHLCRSVSKGQVHAVICAGYTYSSQHQKSGRVPRPGSSGEEEAGGPARAERHRCLAQVTEKCHFDRLGPEALLEPASLHSARVEARRGQ